MHPHIGCIVTAARREWGAHGKDELPMAWQDNNGGGDRGPWGKALEVLAVVAAVADNSPPILMTS